MYLKPQKVITETRVIFENDTSFNIGPEVRAGIPNREVGNEAKLVDLRMID